MSTPLRPLKKRELQAILGMADEMASCSDYMLHDEDTGDILGRDPDIDDLLVRFRRQFKLKKP